MPGLIHGALDRLSQQTCREDAARRLGEAEIAFTEITRVDPDAILYVRGKGDDRKAMTAWLRRSEGRDEIVTEAGFPAEPSPHVPQLHGDGWG